MKERDNIRFWDASGLEQTSDIHNRCSIPWLETQLQARFPNEILSVASVEVYQNGRYKRKGRGLLLRLLGAASTLKGLPAFCEVQLEHKTGAFTERIVVWSPLAWNDRFAGTAGGGTVTGGIGHITAPNNTSRGLFLPIAIINGFTAATTDAGNPAGSNNWALDPKTRTLHWDLIENWRARSTHFMTVFGKAVAELLHGRPVRYAYLHGGSGGGRQSIVEAQEFPGDYDGIWASCPAINWTKFVIGGFWPIAVMNSYGNVLSPAKLKYFASAVHASVGGIEAFYKLDARVAFDPATLVGDKCKGGRITELDATVMREIWDGPHRANGERLWYWFWPGVTFWLVGIPVSALYYTLIGRKPKPFPMCPSYARWVLQDPKWDCSALTMKAFEALFDASIDVFPNAGGDNADLRPFAQAGGKLMIDHGTEDPLIPVDGTLDYYDRMCSIHGGKEQTDAFCRLYITPGDGHGNCSGQGPGLTEVDGMRALIDWVENGNAPDALRTVQVKRFSGEMLCEGMQTPYQKR